MASISIGQTWMWIAFISFILLMLALDLFVFGGRKAHRVPVKEALSWVCAWCALSLGFGGLLWWYLHGMFGATVAHAKAFEFFTGYLIELSLSVDNMFIFVMIFKFFAVPAELQRRVLLYGVLGAIVMRCAMILAGVWLVSQFSWILYLFGAFLVFTGLKMLIFAEHEPDLEQNPVLRWLKNHLRITKEYHGENFFVKQSGLLYVTPLFLVLVFIELSDLVFAVDSIPAIFAVTTDPFIVFTSNIFAIMGLRAMYFLLADMANRFHLLKYGLSIVLVFIGCKMLAMPWFHMPIQWSLSIVGSIILTSVVLSLYLTRSQIQTKTTTQPLLNPSHTRRDSDGRLIQVTIDSRMKLSSNQENIWLVAIDGSPFALQAIKKAIRLSRMEKCVIHLIYVHPWLSKEAAETELMQRGYDISSVARKLLDEHHIPWQLHILMGEPAEQIVAVANTLKCAGIVIGSKGLGATEALLLGSVAYKVIHQSHTSVLVVR